jgi:hypothetical protein
MKDKIVEVRFRDTCTTGRWRSREAAKKCNSFRAKAVGYLVSEDEREIRLAQLSGCSEGDCNEVTTIPKGAIYSRRQL